MSTAEEWVNGKLKQYSDSAPQIPIDEILERLWCDGASLAGGIWENKETMSMIAAKAAIYNLLEGAAIDYDFGTAQVVAKNKAVPLDKIKEMLNES